MVRECFVLFYVILLLSEVSLFHIQWNEVNSLSKGEENKLSKRQIACSSILQDEVPTSTRPTIMSDEDKKKLQARLFEGLLHFGTVVNHIDTFIMDKSKMILKSIGKMAASDEDTRFQM